MTPSYITTFCILFAFVLTFQHVISIPLTVVSDKSGEQQVKEALKKAEREAEKAAKENKTNDKPQNSQTSRSIKKLETSHGTNDHEDESNKRMKAMAAKLNNLVLKFQRKVMANKLHHDFQRRVALENAKKKSLQESKSLLKSSAMDLNSLGDPLASVNNVMSTPYKEDTKLEDRLALEAEEEKKFNNGETYNDDGGYGDSMKSYAGTTSLSPKEQASQEMQRYNALISSESSRELSQIQNEITKATQSSMGKVTVQGESQKAGVDPADQQTPSFSLGKDLNLGGLNLGGTGGDSGLEGLGSLGGASAVSQTSLAGLPGMGGLNLGGQSEDVSALPGASQDQTAGGAIDIGPSGAVQQLGSLNQNTEQQIPGMANGASDVQVGGGQDGVQQPEASLPQLQGMFNKKSKISSHVRNKAVKSKHQKRRHQIAQ